MEPQILLKYVKYPDPLIRSCQEITLPVAFPISATHSSIPRWVTTNIYKLTAQTSEVDFVAEGLQMAHEIRMKLRALRVALDSMSDGRELVYIYLIIYIYIIVYIYIWLIEKR